ncbi:MAG: hypothetical protein AAF412_15225 [Pseudomonadota bacterium]
MDDESETHTKTNIMTSLELSMLGLPQWILAVRITLSKLTIVL